MCEERSRARSRGSWLPPGASHQPSRRPRRSRADGPANDRGPEAAQSGVQRSAIPAAVRCAASVVTSAPQLQVPARAGGSSWAEIPAMRGITTHDHAHCDRCGTRCGYPPRHDVSYLPTRSSSTSAAFVPLDSWHGVRAWLCPASGPGSVHDRATGEVDLARGDGAGPVGRSEDGDVGDLAVAGQATCQQADGTGPARGFSRARSRAEAASQSRAGGRARSRAGGRARSRADAVWPPVVVVVSG